DERPAQVRGALLAEAAAAVDLARLAPARAEAGVANELRGRAEAADVAELGSDRGAQHPGDPGTGGEQTHVAVIGPEPTQPTALRGDLLVEDLDQSAARLQTRLPRLGQLQTLQDPPAAGAEQLTGRRLDAVLEQERVHAALQRRPLLHQIEPEPCPLPLGAHPRIPEPPPRPEV